jgi:hypothetical protein
VDGWAEGWAEGWADSGERVRRGFKVHDLASEV